MLILKILFILYLFQIVVALVDLCTTNRYSSRQNFFLSLIPFIFVKKIFTIIMSKFEELS